MATEYLGIDIGGTNVKMGIVNSETGQIFNFYSHDSVSWRKSEHFEERLGEAIALQLIEHKNITKVGIGLPGMINLARTIPIEITAIPELNNVPMVEILKKRFPNIDFFLENDANAAALGEFYFGEERIQESYIFITLGTGVGGAAIINKKIFTGGRGNAMEPGHTPSANGKVLERNIGKNDLLEMAHALRKLYKGESQLLDEEELTTTGLVAAASEGDVLALQIFDKVGELLGESLCHLIATLDINHILVGGGLSASFDYILPAMKRTFTYWLTKYHADGLNITKATLGNDAGLLGAASLCF